MTTAQDKSLQAKQQARRSKGKGGGQFVSQGGPRAAAAKPPSVDLSSPVGTHESLRWAQVKAGMIRARSERLREAANRMDEDGLLRKKDLQEWESSLSFARACGEFADRLEKHLLDNRPVGTHELSTGETVEITEKERVEVDDESVWNQLTSNARTVEEMRLAIDRVHAAPKWKPSKLKRLIDFDEFCAEKVEGSGPRLIPAAWSDDRPDGAMGEGWLESQRHRGHTDLISMMSGYPREIFEKLVAMEFEYNDRAAAQSDGWLEDPESDSPVAVRLNWGADDPDGAEWGTTKAYEEMAFLSKDEDLVMMDVERYRDWNDRCIDILVNAIPPGEAWRLSQEYRKASKDLYEAAAPYNTVLSEACLKTNQKLLDDTEQDFKRSPGLRDAAYSTPMAWLPTVDPAERGTELWDAVSLDNVGFKEGERRHNSFRPPRIVLRRGMKGPVVGVLTSGDRYKGFDHEEIKDRLAVAANGDPKRYAEMYREACRDEWKTKELEADRTLRKHTAPSYERKVIGLS